MQKIEVGSPLNHIYHELPRVWLSRCKNCFADVKIRRLWSRGFGLRFLALLDGDPERANGTMYYGTQAIIFVHPSEMSLPQDLKSPLLPYSLRHRSF